jgi:hypothetical protein
MEQTTNPTREIPPGDEPLTKNKVWVALDDMLTQCSFFRKESKLVYHPSEQRPYEIDDKALVIPTLNPKIRNDANFMMFNPLIDGGGGVNKCVDLLMTNMGKTLHVRMLQFISECISLGVNTGSHAQFVSTQYDILQILKDVDQTLMDNWLKVLQKRTFSQEAACVSFHLRRNGNVRGKNYGRVCVARFPFYEVCAKGERRIAGVSFRKKDFETFKKLFEYVFPGLNDLERWSFGMNGMSSVQAKALTVGFREVATAINEVTTMLADRMAMPEKCLTNLDWVGTILSIENPDLLADLHALPTMLVSKETTAVTPVAAPAIIPPKRMGEIPPAPAIIPPPEKKFINQQVARPPAPSTPVRAATPMTETTTSPAEKTDGISLTELLKKRATTTVMAPSVHPQSTAGAARMTVDASGQSWVVHPDGRMVALVTGAVNLPAAAPQAPVIDATTPVDQGPDGRHYFRTNMGPVPARWENNRWVPAGPPVQNTLPQNGSLPPTHQVMRQPAWAATNSVTTLGSSLPPASTGWGAPVNPNVSTGWLPSAPAAAINRGGSGWYNQ